MRLYTIRPLEWNKQAKNNWVCEGISYLYTTQPEHHRIRLYCSKKHSSSRAELYDFDSYHDMMHFATEHNTQAALKFLKEVTCESNSQSQKSI